MSQRFTMDHAEQLVARSADREYGIVLEHGTLELGYYAPPGTDQQQPHDRDELYFIASGSGSFVLNGERQPFVRGEALFVPAGAKHRFEDFSEDFRAWVIFYGPAGGEKT